jgi:hypothetical protein
MWGWIATLRQNQTPDPLCLTVFGAGAHGGQRWPSEGLANPRAPL